MFKRIGLKQVFSLLVAASLLWTAMLPAIPVKAEEAAVFVSVAAGSNHNVALKSDGTVWAWGYNNSGQLGDGTQVNKLIPTQVLGLTDVKQVAAGEGFSMAVKNDGTLWSWGSGALGDATIEQSLTPMKISTLEEVDKVVAGYQFALALKEDGTVWTWGYNHHGQIGDGTTTRKKAPVHVLSGAIDITAGAYHSVAVMDDGTLMAWGRNSECQLGTGDTTQSETPVSVVDLTNVTNVISGLYHNIAFKNDGAVWVWGGNSQGALGIGNTANQWTPVQLEGFSTSDTFIAGYYHTIAIGSDGSVLSWGRNGDGQLGDRSTTHRNIPVPVRNSDSSEFTGAVTAAGGLSHTVAIKNGGIVAWGNNQYGQFGNGASSTQNKLYAEEIVIPDAPAFSPSSQAAPGTLNGTTSLSGAAPETGNRLVARVSSTIVATPKTGAAAPTGSGVIDPYAAGSDISGVDATTNKYVSLYEIDADNKIVRFQSITLSLDDIRTFDGSGNVAYVTSYSTGAIDVVDLLSNEPELSKFRIQDIPGGISPNPQPNSAGFNPNGKQVFITVRNENRVIVIDTSGADNPPVSVGVGFSPHGVAFSPDGSLAYIANYGGDTLSVVNTANLAAPAGSISLEEGCAPIDLAVAGSKMYVTCTELSKAISFPLESPQLQTSIELYADGSAPPDDGTGPYGLSSNADGSKVYVAQNFSSEVAVINTATDTLEMLIAIPYEGFAAGTSATEVSPDGSLVYAVNVFENSISVIDAITNTLSDTIALGGNKLPYVIGVSKDGNRLYTVNYMDNSMSVVSSVSRTVIDTVNVSAGPFMVGNFMMPVAVAINAESMPPASPALQPPTTGVGQVTFSWSKIDEADQYKLYVSNTPGVYGEAEAIVSDSALGQINEKVHVVLNDGVYSVTISELTGGTTYYFAVTSVNANGESLKTNMIEAVPAVSALPFAGGNGSQDDPYWITDAYELNNVRNYLDKHFIVMNDIDMNVAPYNSGSGWEPIGVATSDPLTAFTGSFNGGGYEIRNLFSASTGRFTGLFGYAYSAVIRNVALTNVSIQMGDTRMAGGMTGALAGLIEDTEVHHVHSSGEITRRDSVGGLIGLASGSTRIANSSSSVNVLVPKDGNGLFEPELNAGSPLLYIDDVRGGLVGNAAGVPSHRVSIVDSHATGTVEGIRNIGGLIGAGEYVDIGRSYAAGDVTGYVWSYNGENLQWPTNTGGLAGSLIEATVSQSYSGIPIDGHKQQIVKGHNRSGGFAGESENSVYTNNYSRSYVGGNEAAGFIYSFAGTNVIDFAYFAGGVNQDESNWYAFAPGDDSTGSTVYYDMELMPGSSGIGTGLSTVEMKTRSSFDNSTANWDFAHTWGIDPAINDGYPYFGSSPDLPAPDFMPIPAAQPGTQSGTTSLAGVAAGAGNHLAVKVSSSSILRPNAGDLAPTGAGVIVPYTGGSDILGVDAVANKYIGLYEVDSHNKIVKFSLMTLTSSNIKQDQSGQPGSNPSPGAPSTPVKEELLVDVAAGEGEVIAKTPVERTTYPDGTVEDNVIFAPERAEEVINQLMGKESKTARIIIPDKEDKVSETNVHVPLLALNRLADSEVNIEIETEGARVIIPSASLEGFDDDLYFRFIPIKQEDERRQAAERAKREEAVREISRTLEINVIGRPMTIETNLQSRPVTLIMPLQDALPANEAERQAIMDNLVIFIEHSDGTKELIRGEIVSNPQGEAGVRFSVDKFSTFTMLYMNGAQQYFDGQSDESGQAGTHSPYILGFPDGTFGPDKTVTRAQMATMLARNLDIPYSGQGTASFTDMDNKHWAFQELEIVNQIGLMIGYSDGRFGAEDGITRAQMAVIADRWLIQQGEETPVRAIEMNYSDLSSKHWAYDAIMRIQACDVMEGYEDQSFRPDQWLTRAEAVKVVNRLFARGPLYGVQQPGFSDVPVTHWAFNEIEEAAREHHWKLDQHGVEVIGE